MLKYRLFLIISFLLLVNCLCHAQQMFNYKAIEPHPRLLLNEADEARVLIAIKSNYQLKSIHDYIIGKSNGFISKDAVTYEKKGKRLLAVSREALTRIFYLSYAYRMTKEDKYLRRAEEELNTICKFKDWNPSHFLDVGEMTMAVAIGYDWLYNNLKDSTKENIRNAIISHAFEVSNDEDYNWFLSAINNWNQVCNAGLIYGALAIFEDHEDESKEIIERSVKSNFLSMTSYAPDGNYPEGAGYWDYGTGFEVMLIAALESALGSDAGLSKQQGFMQTAEYMLFSNGPTKLIFNYSDCARKQAANVPMFWFAEKLNNPNLLFEEKKLLDDGSFLRRIGDGRLLPIALIYSKTLFLPNITPPAKNVWSGNGLTPVVMVRTDWQSPGSEYLGVKGGTATTSHAHMDAGSFVYDSKGLRWSMDFGLQSYITLESKGVDLWNKKQNSQRWDVFRYNNKNHSTITINNKNHNVNGKSLLIETYNTAEEKGGSFDMTEIFGCDVKSAVRKVVLKDDVYLEVEDVIITNDSSATVRWTMVTPSKAKIVNKNRIELTQEGKKKILEVNSVNTFELKTWNSENPGTAYDLKNPGTVLVGFESHIPANQKALFTVTLK